MTPTKNTTMDDDLLTKMAVEELLQEAKRGALRAETMGPSGFRKPAMKANKQFFRNTLRNVVTNNKRIASNRLPNTSEAK